MCLVVHSCPTLCGPLDCSLPGSFVHGAFQARILELVAFLSSRESSQPRSQTRNSCVSTLAVGTFTISATWELLCRVITIRHRNDAEK